MKKNSTIFPLVLALLVSFAVSNPLSAQTAIGGNTPNGSAMLDVQSTDKGVLFPRMTSAARDAITSPATGLMIFNSQTGCLEINLGNGTALWQSIKCPTPGSISTLDCASRTLSNFPLIPGTPATNQSVTVPYTGGDGNAYSGQTVASTGVTGLTANLSFGYFASGAGNLTYNITGTPSALGTASFALNIGGQTCVLNVSITCGAFISAGVLKEFMCHNLGANTSAAPFTPSWELNGNYYKWGNSTVAAAGPTNGSTPNSTAPANWNTITAGGIGAWTDSPNPMPNNPCPAGYRVPTRQQLNGVIDNSLNPQIEVGSWVDGINNYTSGKFFGSGLFLPAAGYRGFNGSLFSRDEVGNYWSSTGFDSSAAYVLEFTRLSNFTSPYFTGNGYSIRCIAE